MEARQDSEEFAVVAFWDLDETDVFECTRFFIVPYPQLREIKRVQGSILFEFLQVSEHTKEVFFFFKGRDMVES